MLSPRLYLFLWLPVILIGVMLRFIFLDQDLPGVGLTQYYAEDELFYTAGAFNLLNYGDIDYQITDYVLPDATALASPLINWSTYASLSIFGNNYYGLRTPALVANWLCLGLIIFLLLNMFKDLSEKKPSSRDLCSSPSALWLSILIIYCCIDFSFTLSAKVLEPTIFRMAATLFTITTGFLIFKDNNYSPIRFIALGAIAGASFIFVYLTNAFLPAAAILFAFIIGKAFSLRQRLSNVCFCSIGIIIALMTYSLYFDYHSPNGLIEELRKLFSVFGSRVNVPTEGGGASSTPFVVKLIMNMLATLTSNIFRLNPVVLLLFLLSIPVYLHYTWKSRRCLDLLILCIWITFSAQSLLLNNFGIRKMLFMLPFVVFSVFRAGAHVASFKTALSECRLWQKGVFLVYVSVAVSLTFLCLGVNSLISLMPNYDTRLSPALSLWNLIALMTFLAILIRTWKKNLTKTGPVFICFLAVITVSNAMLQWEHNLTPEFKRRDTLISLSEKMDGHYVAGGESIAMRLYSNATYFMNPFRYLKQDTDTATMHNDEYGQIVQKLIADKKLDYAFARINESRFDMTKMGFELIETYDLNAEPERKYIGLYRAIEPK